MKRNPRNFLLGVLLLLIGVFAFTQIDGSGTFTRLNPLVRQAQLAPKQFDGRYLYKEAFEAIRDNALPLVDPAERAKWAAEWEHKHDKDNALDTEEGTDKAIHEMLASLKQRFDHYSDAAQAKAEQEAFNSSLVGIGTTIGQPKLAEALKALPEKPTREQVIEALKISENNPFVIDEPFEGGPAEKAGLKPGDQVLEVDGKSVNGRLSEEVVNDIRGKAGTTVKIKVRRTDDAGNVSELTFDITRASLTVKTTKFQDLGNGISYVKLRGFSSQYTVKEMQDALTKAAKGKGLILDLRGNPGGRLDFVQAISTFILKDGTMMAIRARDGDAIRETRIVLQPKFILVSEESSDSPGNISIDTGKRPSLIIPETMPVVVLVDRGSASASEILAGLLKENHRATIIGETTLGKGVGQAVIPLAYGRSISVTTFEFLPGGAAMDYVGIIPHVTVKRGSDPKVDEQLDAAKKKVEELIAAQSDLEQTKSDLRQKNEDEFKKVLEKRSQP